jgi:hypothetical protein
MGHAQGRGQEHEMAVFDAGGENGPAGVVGRATVGVDEDTMEFGKVLTQPGVGRAHHVLDGPRIVVAGNADDHVGFPDGFSGAAGLIRQSILHRC